MSEPKHEVPTHPDSLLVDLIASAGDPRRTLELILLRIQTASGADRVSVGANRERTTGTEILVLGEVGEGVPFIHRGREAPAGLQLVDSPSPLPADTVWEELGRGEPHPIAQALAGAGFRSAASFSLHVSGHPSATLYLVSRTPGFFTEDRLEIVRKYRHSAAVVSHHLLFVLRHEQQQQSLAASLALVDDLIPTQGLTQTGRQLVERGIDRLALDRLALFLAEPEGGRFSCLAFRDRESPALEAPALSLDVEGIPGLRAILSGVPLAVSHARVPFPDAAVELLRLRPEGWLLLVPLRAGGKVLGLLVGQTGPEMPAPATADMEAMQLLGLQLGLLLENRRSTDLQERNARNLTGLLGMSQAVASLVDLQRVPELVARHARDLCDADEATVFVAEDDGILRPVVCLGAYSEQVLQVRLRMGQGLTGRVAQNRRGEMLNHAESDPRVLNIPNTPQERESLLSVPLVAADRLIGVLTLHKLEGRTFDPADLDTLEIFAAQAAAAMKSARLLEDLREERSRLVTMLQQMEAGVAFAGRDGHVILLNAAARKVLRVEDEELEPPLPDLLRRAELEGLLETLEGMESKGQLHATREEAIGGRTFICSITASRDEQGGAGGTILLFKDVTELKEIELQLLQSSKMSAVGQLAAGIAHEFNNLIAAIYGYAQFMKEHPDGKTVQKGVEVILRTSERARGLTGTLLTYSRRRPGRNEAVDLNRLLGDTLLLLSRQLERSRIEVTTDLAELPPAVVDAGRIQQVFLDLLLNAQQAMAQGGALTVRSRIEEEGILIEVEDTGPGIPAAIQDRIFEPFFTTKGALGGTKTPGTGLGLSVAYNVLRDHGGSIRVRSEPGRGACFRVTLPLPQTAPRSLPAAGEGEGGPAPARILVAEDDPRLSRRILELLEGLGHEVIAAGEGDGLPEAIATEEVHMLLLARRSTAHDPLLTYQRIRQAHPGLPVVFLTERGDSEPLEAEGDSWIFRINKPFRDRDLIALVSRVLKRRISRGDRAA